MSDARPVADDDDDDKRKRTAHAVQQVKSALAEGCMCVHTADCAMSLTDARASAFMYALNARALQDDAMRAAGKEQARIVPAARAPQWCKEPTQMCFLCARVACKECEEKWRNEKLGPSVAKTPCMRNCCLPMDTVKECLRTADVHARDVMLDTVQKFQDAKRGKAGVKLHQPVQTWATGAGLRRRGGAARPQVVNIMPELPRTFGETETAMCKDVLAFIETYLCHVVAKCHDDVAFVRIQCTDGVLLCHAKMWNVIIPAVLYAEDTTDTGAVGLSSCEC